MGLLSKLVDKSIDRTMDYILRNCIIYNVAWEDPRIDGKVLQIGPEDTMLMLTTGGCNVLDRLLDGAKHIVSVDLNVAQNALLELKLAGARALTHEQFFQLFAHSNRKLFDAVYEPRLRPLLSPSAAAFWDTHASFFDSVQYSGASGGLARALTWLAWLFGLQPLLHSLLTCATLEEQRAVMKTHERKVERLIAAFDWLLPVFCPFAGVPASQLRLEASSRAEGGDPRSIIGLFIDRVFKQTHIASDNYFYYGYLYGKYSRTCCPRYLQPEYFEKLKAGATRVEVKTCFLHEAAAAFPDGYFTAMVLLDHMDWLTTEQIQQEWAVFARKLHPTTGRVLWRSFAYDLRSTPPLKFLSFDRQAVDAAETETPDRVGMYNSCHLATIPPNLVLCEAPPVPAPLPPTLGSRLGALLQTLAGALAAVVALLGVLVCALPLLGALVAPLVNAFVGAFTGVAGALFGDASEVAPPGKRLLFQLLPGLRGGSWIDLCGGLADELRAQRAESVCHYAKVELVTLPGTRAATSGTGTLSGLRHTVSSQQLQLKKGPAVRELSLESCAPETARAAGLARASADLVTLVHGLVSEAEWESRLELALSLLKPGGYLAVADLAPPSGKGATAFWKAVCTGRAGQRVAAPYHGGVKAKLHQALMPIHESTAAASTPGLAAPCPAHFIYIGRKVV